MRKLAKIIMAGALAVTVMGITANADEIKVWVADNVVDFTNGQIEAFKEANPDYADYDYVVEPVGEGDAAGNMITDVEAGADIYGFAQDQIARLVSAGALIDVEPENAEKVKAENDPGSVAAATVGDTLYAYPLTSDNGYFLYYDKSVVTDPSSLEAIVADCEAAGKNFYMEINEGLVALKEMVELKASKAFQNGSAAGEATNVAAIVDGTWDAGAVQDLFGDNYACAKLPTFEGSDGNTYQMSGFGGFKLLGVKPQEDEDKLAACDALAAWLSGEEAQIARFEAVEWGPSNLAAQGSDAVQANEALAALGEQLQFTIPQGQYPGDYWSLATSLGDSIISGELSKDSSDDDLMAALEKFQETCQSYAQ